MKLEYIVTETSGPDSFDPLDADKSQNISVMRMLYATPIEVTSKNELKSSVLEYFSYDQDKKEILLRLRDQVHYVDGSKITASDVALSVARMAYFRPKFPVIRDIVGLSDWVNSKKGLIGLPKGIEINGAEVKILLSQNHMNPLFRLCLELFSIIPEKCVDKTTGNLNCTHPPVSGYFKLIDSNKSSITFQKRSDVPSPIEEIRYDEIIFRFETLADACKRKIGDNTLISGSELEFYSSNCQQHISSEQVHWLPASRFGVLRFNPSTAPFNNELNRQFFAKVFRNILKKENSKILTEQSLFTRLIPGYLETSSFSDVQDRSVNFSDVEIVLPEVEDSGLKIISDTIIRTAESLGMKVIRIQDLPYSQILTHFLQGKIPVVAGASGFWAQDPVGDVSMWFTPNLHKTMTFIWNDQELYRQLDLLTAEVDFSNLKPKMETLNRHISKSALIAPVAHFRRIFISSPGTSSLDLSQSVTSPAPWQVVPTRDL